MAGKRALKLRCPICKKPVESQQADSPLCSERCRLIDLGKWASGAYVISSPLPDTADSVPGPERQPDHSDED